MTETVPERVALGANTNVRRWYVDVNTGTDAAPTWTPLCGITECKPTYEITRQDISDFDSDGATSSQATAYTWGLELKLRRGVTTADATAYDPGQEAIRLAAAEIGLANAISVRFYEMEPNGPRVEAYQGTVGADWAPDGGPMDATATVSATLSGIGARTAITHPDAAA